MLHNIAKETEDTPFWKNLKLVAPFFFVFACEKDETLAEIRDGMFTEEILKTKH